MTYVFKPEWQTALDALCDRVLEIHNLSGDVWPYHCDPNDGEWDFTEDGDWCGGHWVECLRIAGELTGNEDLLSAAEMRSEWLRQYLERDDMFRGHRFYYGPARQYAWTGNPKYRTLALAGAYAVRSMAMHVNGAMPIGTQVQVRSTQIFGRDTVCIDNVHPNLILDWWGYEETGDETFIEGARKMLDLTWRDFVLEDGSSIEFRKYNTETGEPGPHFTLLGAHDDSCWSRGQSWAVAGYLRAWEAIGDERYLNYGKKMLDYWVRETDDSMVPAWDFKDPKLKTNPADVPLDTSASAIVVEQLARLAILDTKHVQAREIATMVTPFVDGLLQHLTVPGDDSGLPPGVLKNGCFNGPKPYADRSELIWGTAYLMFALYYLKTGRVVE